MSDAAQTSQTSTSAPATSKPARSRSGGSKRKQNDYGDRLTVLGDRFVCSYSGRLCERAVRIPGLEEDQGICENYKNAICEEYEQSVNNVVRAPMRTQLMDFGGDLDYQSWLGPLSFWDVLTGEKGLTVAELSQSKKGGPVKKKTKSASKLDFAAGMYVIYHNKAPKPVNAIDGAEKEEGEKVKAKLTPVGAMRKLGSFCHTHKEQSWGARCKMDESFVAHFTVTDAPVDKLVNKTGSLLVGEPCYGPVVVVFTKKFSLKLQ